jgi:hypothetical protein
VSFFHIKQDRENLHNHREKGGKKKREGGEQKKSLFTSRRKEVKREKRDDKTVTKVHIVTRFVASQ